MMLFCCKTNDHDEIMERAACLVSENRRKKALRLPTRRARANSLATELLARYALEQYGISQEELYFDKTGRPRVKEDIAFLSLSHSGEYVACAVSERPVGVDVQKIKPVSRLVIVRVCTAAERESLSHAADVPTAFTRLWSLKEAWRKANPDAGPKEMLRAEFFLDEDRLVQGPSGFCYTVPDAPEGYALALCEALG